MLSFGIEFFVFQFVIQNFKDEDTQKYNFSCCFYGCEILSVTLREKRRLRVCENMMLRRIIRSKRYDVMVEWRKKHKEELNPLNPKLNPICYLLALLGAHHFLHVSRIRVKLLTFRLLMSYIYIYIYIYMTLVA